MKKIFLRFIIILSALLLVAIFTVLGISAYVVKSSEDKIVESVDSDADCIVVLGAKVRDGQPSLMLRDRLDRAIEIYFETGTPILMSGDHSSEEYNEVAVMKAYALSKGVPEEDIYLDPEGYSTLETVTNAKALGFDSVIVVTQRYHLYRALYICDRAEVDAVGVAAEDIHYYGETRRLVREQIARTKDFLYTLFI